MSSASLPSSLGRCFHGTFHETIKLATRQTCLTKARRFTLLTCLDRVVYNRPCCLLAGTEERRDHPPLEIFWDLDNVHPGNVDNLRQMAEEIVAAMELVFLVPLGGVRNNAFMPCHLFANDRSFDRLGADENLMISMLQDCCFPILTVTEVRKQSADLAMRQKMFGFAKQHGAGAGCMACISDDVDFAPVIRYCRSLGCRVLSIGRHRSNKRPSWARPRRLSSLPLPVAAGAAVALTRLPTTFSTVSTRKYEWIICDFWFSDDFKGADMAQMGIEALKEHHRCE